MIGYHNFHYISPLPYPRKQGRYTLHFVVSGHGYLIVNGEKFTINPHDVFCLDNECTFSYYPDKNDPWEYVFFVFDGERAVDYKTTPDFSNTNPVKSCRHPQKITSMLASALQKKENGRPISYFEVTALFFLLLDSVTDTESDREFFYESSFIEEVKDFVQMKYLEPEFNVKYLCDCMHISHSHLCRIFKQSEKMSIISYINQLKMARAEELLLTTNFTITEVSYMSGYREYEYFLRLFKRMHGVSPTEYRKINKDR
ncbi:MAG: helix-turn-helix domain-containing protein [Clostridia bacterium]|nr:helix-turn-helix domain-containing protein [Clostridia bacterium]